MDAVREGRAGVQDEGSQLVAARAGRTRPLEGRDERWLDGCAGPGGKAALLAALAAAARRRAARRPRSSRTGPGWWRARWPGNPGPYQVIAADGTRPPGARAPSTGSWSTCPAPASARCAAGPRPAGGAAPRTWTGFAPLQRGLLREALRAVRVGGVVGYATCSPHPAETRAVVDDVLKARRRAGPPSGSTPAR